MDQDTGYYVIKKQAVPEVLLKVVEAKKLLESGKVKTAAEAAARLGISRSSFYKYKEDIYEFHDSLQGTTLTLTFQMNDEVGLLSYVLNLIADLGANILTIHQSIPLNGVASLSITRYLSKLTSPPLTATYPSALALIGTAVNRAAVIPSEAAKADIFLVFIIFPPL